MLINSILCSVESMYGLTNTHIQKLESVDKYLLRKIFNASSSTTTEALYLETGALPIRFIIKSRRLMFYWTILSKKESELVRKVYNVLRWIFENSINALLCYIKPSLCKNVIIDKLSF